MTFEAQPAVPASGDDEEVLTGGGTTPVVRVGRTVRRPLRPWTPAVHRLLEHLRAGGFDGAPNVLGTDSQGREVLEYVDGEVGNYPVSHQVRSHGALVSAGRLLRAFHDATSGLVRQDAGGWQLPALDPVEVICHGDVAPYNCVFVDGAAVALIDFDTARPGPRAWDLAYALYRFAPLSNPTSPDGFGTPPEQAGRARAFLDSYGCTPEQRRAAVDLVAPRLHALIDHIRTAAAAGDAAFAGHIADGHVDLYLRDLRYIAEQQPLWDEVVVGDR